MSWRAGKEGHWLSFIVLCLYRQLLLAPNINQGTTWLTRCKPKSFAPNDGRTSCCSWNQRSWYLGCPSLAILLSFNVFPPRELEAQVSNLYFAPEGQILPHCRSKHSS